VLPRRLSCLTALAFVAACARSAPPEPAVPTNVLLVTLDTTRADRIGRGFTPNIDRVAAQGLRFTDARSVVPLTLPAHVSIMTGYLPAGHGIRLNGAGRFTGPPTIAVDLQHRGYATRAVVGAFVLDRRFGLYAGFDEYDDKIARRPDATDLLEAERPANDVVDRALGMLDALPATAPWFLWVHVYDAHAPYRPPAAALARAGGDAYNGEIAFVDEQLGRLFARLDARQDAGRTATIIVGDHGESLGEHGEPTHGMLLFEPALRVPFIIRAPGVAPGDRHDFADITDVTPTIAGITAQNAGGWMGHDLLGAPPERDESISETDYPTAAGWSRLRALVNGRWKLIVSSRAQLFDLAADPGEQRDVSAAQPNLARSMAESLTLAESSFEQSTKRPPATGSLPADTAARLQSLGYVAATRPAAPPKSDAIDPSTVMPDWAAFEAALAAVTDGRPAEALPALARVAKAYPDASLFAVTYARALSAAGKKREALERFRAAVATWPTDPSLYHELAVAARESGLAVEALRAEQASLAISPGNPLALNGKGLLLADAGRDSEAAQAFEAASAADPTNAVYLANLGNARRAAGDLEGAEDAYRRALERNGSLADAANGLGVILVQQQRARDAVPFLEQAARDQSFVEAQLNLGIALQQSGDPARAAMQYRKVLDAPARYRREREAARTLLAQVDRR